MKWPSFFNNKQKKQIKLLQNIQSRVINRLNLDPRDFTEMVNTKLRDNYGKPRMDVWCDMTEEECVKVLEGYGNLRM